jgi:hypothetical protein
MRVVAGILLFVVAVINIWTGLHDSFYGYARGFWGIEGIGASTAIEQGGDIPLGTQLEEESRELAKVGGSQAGYGVGKLVLAGLEVVSAILVLAGAGVFFIRFTAVLEIVSVVVAVTVMESNSYFLFGLSAVAVLMALIVAQTFRATKAGRNGKGDVSPPFEETPPVSAAVSG